MEALRESMGVAVHMAMSCIRSGVDNMATAGWRTYSLDWLPRCFVAFAMRLGVPYKWDHLENIGDAAAPVGHWGSVYGTGV